MRRTSRALITVGALALFLGLIAGVFNRQLVDSNNFVEHADAVRTDDEVSRRIAVILTDEILAAEPNAVIARPLLQATLQAGIRSPAFRPVFETAVGPLHDAFVSGSSDAVVFRLADIGAVLIAAARTAFPDAVATIPSDLDVVLAEIGAGSFESRAIGWADQVQTAAWLLPLLALMCFAGAVLLDRRRWVGVVRGIGIAFVAVGFGIAVTNLVATYAIERLAAESLRGAILVAGWNDLNSSVLTVAAFAVAAGYLLYAAMQVVSGQSIPILGALGSPTTWFDRAQPASAAVATGRAAIMIGLGVALVAEPLRAVAFLVVGFGLWLVARGVVAGVFAVPEFIRQLLSKQGRAKVTAALERPAVRAAAGAAAIGVLAVALIAGVVVWNTTDTSVLRPSRSTTDCNGSADLCDRRYDEIAYPATHNSMSAADQPGWFMAEQPNGVMGQLAAGIRVFLIDTWYGYATDREGVVTNTEEAYDRALAEVEAEYGEEVLAAALRVRDAANLTPRGERDVFLCHGLCVLGSTRWLPLMQQVRAWVQENPREVITFFIQDAVSPQSTAEVIEQAGLLPYAYIPTPGEPWPTLEEMIDAGTTVVFMAENEGGGTAYPWLLDGFEVSQDTPYLARVPAEWSCELFRGPSTASLFLFNHWLSQPLTRVSSARQANSATVLGPRLDECQQERGQIPNFVAVDFYSEGDLFGQVDRLNAAYHDDQESGEE